MTLIPHICSCPGIVSTVGCLKLVRGAQAWCVHQSLPDSSFRPQSEFPAPNGAPGGTAFCPFSPVRVAAQSPRGMQQVDYKVTVRDCQRGGVSSEHSLRMALGKSHLHDPEWRGPLCHKRTSMQQCTIQYQNGSSRAHDLLSERENTFPGSSSRGQKHGGPSHANYPKRELHRRTARLLFLFFFRLFFLDLFFFLGGSVLCSCPFPSSQPSLDPSSVFRLPCHPASPNSRLSATSLVPPSWLFSTPHLFSPVPVE